MLNILIPVLMLMMHTSLASVMYRDAIASHDELYLAPEPLTPTSDGMMYEVPTRYISLLPDGTISTKGNDDEGTDPNADFVQKVLDVVHYNQLQPTSMDKKAYSTHIKSYMRTVRNHLQVHNPNRVSAFMAGAQKVVNQILSNFDEYVFYTGRSMDLDGMLVLGRYASPTDFTPTFMFWRDGLTQETY